MKALETPIDGLFIGSNKTISDERGSLYELVPNGIQNQFFPSHAVGNIYASKAVKKYIPRAGHYHKSCVDIFLTVTGTVLWYFEDFREDSGTRGETFAFTCGESETSPLPSVPHLPNHVNGVTFLLVPTGVYHIYFPLSDTPALIFAVSSEPYNAADYFDPIRDKQEILRRFVKIP
jgi:dTDP-4-dehydrorhamnose 3,5-epimerase-like enzyme